MNNRLVFRVVIRVLIVALGVMVWVVPADAQRRFTIGTLPLAISPGVDQTVADSLEGILLSAMAEIHWLQVIDPHQGTREDEISINIIRGGPERVEMDLDFVLTGTVWTAAAGPEAGYYVILQILDAADGVVLVSDIVDLDRDSIRFSIRNWRENLELALRGTLAGDAGAGARILKNEGFYELAWTYYLRDLRGDLTGDWEFERDIRNALAGETVESLVDLRVLPPQAVDRLLWATLLAVDKQTVLPLQDRIARDHTRILDREFAELERTAARLLRRNELGEARSLLEGDPSMGLRIYQPGRHEALMDELRYHEWAQHIEQNVRLRKNQQFLEARETLASAVLMTVDTARTLEALDTLETHINTVETRALRTVHHADPRGPRIQDETVLWTGLGGLTMRDPLQRYLMNTTALHATVGASSIQSVVPHVRVVRRVGAGFTQFSAVESSLASTGIQGNLDVGYGLGAGTERVEASLTAVGGVSGLYVNRDRSDAASLELFRLGLSAALELEAALYLPGAPVRTSLFFNLGRIVWIPDVYLVSQFSLGIRVGWLR